VSVALAKSYILGLLFETLIIFVFPRAIGGLSTTEDSYFAFSPPTEEEELLQGTVPLLTWHSIGFLGSLYCFHGKP
jgi:hypothetical protein